MAVKAVLMDEYPFITSSLFKWRFSSAKLNLTYQSIDPDPAEDTPV